MAEGPPNFKEIIDTGGNPIEEGFYLVDGSFAYFTGTCLMGRARLIEPYTDCEYSSRFEGESQFKKIPDPESYVARLGEFIESKLEKKLDVLVSRSIFADTKGPGVLVEDSDTRKFP